MIKKTLAIVLFLIVPCFGLTNKEVDKLTSTTMQIGNSCSRLLELVAQINKLKNSDYKVSIQPSITMVDVSDTQKTELFNYYLKLKDELIANVNELP